MISITGRVVKWVHAEKAARMVSDGEASREGRHQVRLQRSLPPPVGEASDLCVASYKTKPYTVTETVKGHQVTQFKHLPDDDRWAFMLSVTDCLAG